MNNYHLQSKTQSVSPHQAAKRVHFSPYQNDRTLNERDFAAVSNTSANFGNQTVHTQHDARDHQNSSMMPADWSRLEGGHLNKSANVGQKPLKLPDKLLKFRDRVKRDRSANLQRDQSRDDSLYGRRKAAGDIDKECQRLRDSYGKHRKLSTQSNNGLATEILQKQNFKEDPFDRDGSFYAQRSRGSVSYDRNLGMPELMRASDKENGFKQSTMVGSFQEQSVSQSGQNQINKYKRTQQKSMQTLANYQQKYERLEKNFKKFSNNIRHANQSEQIIEDLRCKTSLSLIFQSAKKKHFFELRDAFRVWRVNSGVALKQYESQEKLLIMARCCQKMQSKLRNHVKIQFYQRWKQVTFSSASVGGLSGSSRERIASILSDLITNSDNFNRSIENDKFLSLILGSKLQEIFQQHILAVDLLFYSKNNGETLDEEDAQLGLKMYHDLTGEQMDFSNEQIVGQSLLGRVLTQQEPVFDSEWHPITVVESIQSDPDYNYKIDDPLNVERLAHLNQTQTNIFNKVKGLGTVFINFQAPLRLGILRLFFESNRNYTSSINDARHLKSSLPMAPLSQLSLTAFQLRLIKNLTELLPQFIQRIFEVRTQINSLAITSMDQQEQMREMENINCINQKVREIQRRLADVLDKELLLQTVKEEVERALSDGVGGFDLEGIVLKQIVQSQRDQPGSKEEHLIQAKDQQDKELIRFYDHQQEDEEILEDFLDHKKEYYVHQISICPKIPSLNQSSVSVGASQTLPSFGCYTFVLQMQIKYPMQVSGKNKTSMALSPGSKILSHTAHDQSAISAQVNPLAGLNSFIGQTINYAQSLPKRQSLDPILKHRLSLYFRSLVPILTQSQRITSQLIPQVVALEKSLTLQEEKAEVASWLSEFGNSKGLTQQLDPLVLHLELKEAIKYVLLSLEIATSEEEQAICLLLDQAAMSRPQFCSGHWHYKGIMDDEETKIFDELVIQNHKDVFGSKQSQKLNQIIQRDHGLNEVNVQAEMLPRVPEARGEYQFMPIVHPSTPQLIGHVIFKPSSFEGQVPSKLEMLAGVMAQFLNDLSQKRHAYQALQEQHNKLLQQLEGEQVTQEVKDLIHQQLVIPYARKPTLKALGDGLDSLADKLVTNDFERIESANSETGDFGQEINQIAYFKEGIYIEDVRLFNTYAQNKEDGRSAGMPGLSEPNAPDEMLLQSFAQQQQIVYEDEVLDKVVMLYPFVHSHLSASTVNFQRSFNQSMATSCASHQGLVLRFVLDRDDNVQQKLQNINTQLINVVQPVVLAMLQGGIMMRQQLALQKLSQLVERQRHSNSRELMYSLRELKAKNVYTFTRSNLYAKLAKSKRFMELKKQLNEDLDEVRDSPNGCNPEFFDLQKRRMNENQQVQFLIRQALKVINAQAFKYKQSCFRRFVIGTRQDVYGKMSKKKKKATCALATMYSYFVMRRHLNKFAINTKTFRYIRNQNAKATGAAQCLFRNFRVIRERLGFLKLKKNLNLQLRASMTSSQESDKDLFIQLNQILLSSFSQEGGLDGGLSYALGEVFSYIKNLTQRELYIKDVGRNVADDTFAGHIDEVIISIKSNAFQSGGGYAGNILNIGHAAQKSRIFMCRYHHNLAKKGAGVLRINDQQDNELNIDEQMTHQEQFLNQIEANNAELVDEHRIENGQLDDSEHVGEGQNFGCPFHKYVINSKRDLINLMLTKSNGIIFNFQNIQQSLSDIFLSQQSRHKDQNIGNRFSTVKRSKSALIIPMFDVAQSNIIGSFELYRHHQQIFAPEMEARFEYFSKRLADFILLYGQLKAQTYQIEQLRLQMQKTIRPVGNLSALLKNVYLNAPNNHFPGAAHVLPIIILNGASARANDVFSERSLSQNTNYQELFSECGQIGAHMQPHDAASGRLTQQKLAFFYQFKDNHIYNFDYEGTFIDEIMDNKCILEMCPKNAMVPNEGPDHLQSSSQPFHGIDNNFDLQSSTMSMQSGHPGTRSGRQMAQKMEGSSIEKVQSVTNESFKHIVYYPIFDIHDEQKIVAVLEVGFKKLDKKANYQVLSNETHHYLDQFRSQLDQYRIRLASFCKSIESMCARRAEKKTARTFQTWKNAMILAQCKEQFLASQQQALQNQEQCYTEYVQNLDNFNAQLQSANMEKERLHKQIDQFSAEKKAKLKFLATSLVSSQNLFHKVQRQQKRQAFIKWQYNVSIRKIAETAFTRVLQINHKHSKARLRTGVFLLKQLCDKRAVGGAFLNILQAAHMRRHNFRGDRFGFGPGPGVDYSSADGAALRTSKTRNRSAGGNESFILNNITSLLSPENMKRIEQKNLYQKQINSFYQPQHVNNSAVTNARQMNFVTANDGQSLPLIQLKPEEVVRDVGSTNIASTHDQSRFTVQAADFKPSSSNLDFLRTDTRVISRYSNNSFHPARPGLRPADNLNRSQIEQSRDKRDYSPILTTSKYDIKSIYDPLGKYASTGSVQRLLKKRTRSTNSHGLSLKKLGGSCLNVPSMKRGKSSIRTTKCELQKQLYIKQKQLTLLRKQIDHEAHGRKESQGRQPRFISNDRSNHSLDEQKKSAKGSLHEAKITPVPEAYTSLSIRNPPATGATKPEDRLGSSFEKYAKINGRDVSPPVRLSKKIEPHFEGF